MKKRQNVYFGEALAKFISERVGEGTKPSVSGVLDAAAERYQEMLRRYTPETLGAHEWLCVWEALQGLAKSGKVTIPPQALPSAIEDVLEQSDIADKWGIFIAALVEKLRALDWCQRLAVIDAAERFWVRGDWPEDPASRVAAVLGRGAA